jgi:YidC/Oxa1 family membrane protein insertase
MPPYRPALVLAFALALPVAADEVSAVPAPAPAPAPAPTTPAPAVAAPTYQSWTLRNDLVEVVVSELQGSIRAVSLIKERPIHLRDWQVHELQRQKIAMPDPEKPLAVLDDFNPGSGKHNWITGVELPPANGAAPWTATQGDARHLRLEYADAAKGLRWAMAYELTEGKFDLVTTFTIENGGQREWTLQPTVYPLNGVRQDDPSADAAYVSVSYHTGGINGKIVNLGMPGPGTSQPVPATDLDYVCLKSRFFAALWTPLTFAIASKQAQAAPAPAPAPVASAPVESGGPGGGAAPAAVAAAAPNAAGALWLNAHGFSQAQGAAHQAYLEARYLGPANGEVRLAPGQTMTASWKTVVSSMRKNDLALLNEIERSAQYTDGYYRFFKSLAKLLTWLLDAIVWVVINYGVAVVVLTFLLKAALHRTTFKQYESMMKMQKLAPDLKLIQEQYKNDKQKLMQKQTELWKKHSVNPFSGCLPVLIQIPVFTALYMTFSYSADMRGHGFLWVNDLTLPDQVYGWMIGTFPLTINPLPLIYIAVTVWMSLTQKMPSGGDPQQEQMAKTMRWLPVIFGVIFYQMPAGLVLYFTINAVLSTLEIKMVKKKLGMP